MEVLRFDPKNEFHQDLVATATVDDTDLVGTLITSVAGGGFDRVLDRIVNIRNRYLLAECIVRRWKRRLVSDPVFQDDHETGLVCPRPSLPR